MDKVEKKYWCRGEALDLLFDNGIVKCFSNKDHDHCIITDKESNVMFEIHADMSQGMGYMTLTQD